MKKRSIVMAMAALTAVSVVTGCADKVVSSDSTSTPKEIINWTITSGPGGSNDTCTRMISDIMTKESLVSGQPVIIINKADGSNEIGRNEVATTKRGKADYTLLTFNSGDLMPMVRNTKNRSSNFRALAIMAVDKQLIFKGEQAKYVNFREAIEAAESGTKVVTGGSKGDGIAAYDAMLKEIGISKDVMSYTIYDSTGNTITVTLGGHVEFVISKSAAASEYVTASSLTPMLALSTERYAGNLADALTLDEIGDYENVETPVWRDAVAPAAISDAAAIYWSGQPGKVTETDTWRNDCPEKNKLIGNYMDTAAVTEYAIAYEKDYMTANGIQQD